MVFPADDQVLAAMMEHYDDFKNLTCFACPPPEITGRILNKAATLEIAQACGIRVPRTEVVSNSTQLSELVNTLPFPWVLKPTAKETRIEEAKSYSLSTAHDIATRFPIAKEFAPAMLLQEYCAGAGVGVEVLMHKGECHAMFQHRRIQEWPYTGGFSVTAIAEKPDPRLVEQSVALLRALEWDGPAMVEFKLNPSDGSAVLMEVNGRYWGTISLPIMAGVDFPLYHWQLKHDETPKVPNQYAVGTKWRWTAGHAYRTRGLIAASRHSRAARKELALSLLRLPALFSPSFRDSVFDFSDPIPTIVELPQALRHLLHEDMKTLSKHFSPLVRSPAK